MYQVLMNLIKTLRDDIQNIKEVNSNICEKIRLLEEEFEGSDSEESVCIEKDDNMTPQLECNICDFKCEREIT